MDLSKLSREDLEALRSGDLSRVSDAGLLALKGAHQAEASTPTPTAPAVNPGGATEQPQTPMSSTTAPQKMSPTDGMPSGDLFLSGAGKSLVDTADAVKQRWDDAAAGIEGLVPYGKEISQFFGGRTAQQMRGETQARIDERKRLDAPLMGTTSGTLGHIAGTTAVAAPLTLGMSPVAAGAGMGYFTPTASDESTLLNMGAGAAGGWLAGKVVNGVSRVISPYVSPAVKALKDAGVTMTPGQLLGGAANKLEQQLTSVPIVGSAIQDARNRSIVDFNRAVADKVLEPIGMKLPSGVKEGREAVEFLQRALGQRYDDILATLTVKADGQFSQDASRLLSLVRSGNLPPQQAQQFEQILQNQVMGRFMGQNALTGQTFKDIESNLGRLAADYASSGDAAQRQLGGAIRELQSSMRDLVVRTNPQQAQALKATNDAWANLVRMQRASGYVGAEDGVFTPAQLQAAVRATDSSRNKAAFASGQARMQEFSDAGKKVLGNKVPDSGTAGRAANMAALGTGALFAPKVLALGVSGNLAYSKLATKLAQALLTSRPDVAVPIAEQVRLLSPLAQAAASSVGSRVQNKGMSR